MMDTLTGRALVRREVRGAGGDTLHVRVVPADVERRVLVYLHGIESHGGWFLPTAELLADRGVTSVLLDRRGSGVNRHLPVGHADSAEQLLQDVRALRATLDADDVALVGLSWGGKLALAAALDDPAAWSCVTMITPGIAPRVDLTAAQKARLALCWIFRRRARFPIPIEPEMFTETPRWLAAIRADGARLHEVTASFLRASVALDRRVRSGIARLSVPALLLLAERDRIVDNDRTRAIVERAPAGMRTVEIFAGASHSIQFDHTRRLAARIDAFLDEVSER